LTALAPRDEFTRRFVGGPLAMHVLGTRGGPRTIPLRIRLALENWRVTVQARLPPLAREAVSRARARISSPATLLAVRPSFSFLGPPQYDLLLRGSRSLLAFRATLDFERTRIVSFGQTGSTAWLLEPSNNDLLRAKPGTWEVADAALTVAGSRRAFVITSGSVFADIDLANARVRYRKVKAPDGNRLRAAPVLLRGARAFVIRGTLRDRPTTGAIIDLRTARIRRFDCNGRVIEPAGERVMCFGYDLPPTGIRVFDASGRRLYTVLDGSRISRVKAQGPYGYVRLANPHGGDGDAVVFELATGRVLRTVPFSNSITFVIGRNPGWFHAP
jgi:hypothetical protein